MTSWIHCFSVGRLVPTLSDAKYLVFDIQLVTSNSNSSLINQNMHNDICLNLNIDLIADMI